MVRRDEKGMPMPADDIATFLDEARELRREELYDGTGKVLHGYVRGPVFTVCHDRGTDRVEVFRTGHADLAASVYESFDGRDRAWDPVYLPRASEWPDKGALSRPVYAVGASITTCVTGFLDRQGDTLAPDTLVIDEPETGKAHAWGASFVGRDSGTGYKAAGTRVPGGVVMTWWK